MDRYANYISCLNINCITLPNKTQLLMQHLSLAYDLNS